MEHPMKSFLKHQELTPRAFSIFNDLSLETVRGFLYGKCRQVPFNVKKVLIGYGVNVSELEEQYDKWLQWRAELDVLELRKQSRRETAK